MAYETFAVERSSPEITTVWFNRPAKLNPINETVMRELLQITHNFRDDEQTRVVILTGRGRAFSAGADMALLTSRGDPETQRRETDTERLRSSRLGWRLMEDWERLDQVTIAAVNGFAVGGGLSLAMACDFRIAATGARLWIPEVRLGLPYMWGSVTRLINLVGMARAKELVMTCDELSAEQALAVGLVNQVVPAADLQTMTLAFAGKLVARPPMALRRTKEFFKALYTNRAGDITFADGHLGLGCSGTEDTREAISAFREKRPPRAFKNR
jgi:enoyl-CoA hydratase/carnithine racemase